MAAHPDGRLACLVLTHPGGEPLRPRWALIQLRKRRTELDLSGFGLHGLRHTAGQHHDRRRHPPRRRLQDPAALVAVAAVDGPVYG